MKRSAREQDAFDQGYRIGIDEAVMLLRTTSQAATDLGISTGRVRSLAKSLGEGYQLIDGGRSIWVFTPEQMKRLAERPDGRSLRYAATR